MISGPGFVLLSFITLLVALVTAPVYGLGGTLIINAWAQEARMWSGLSLLVED